MFSDEPFWNNDFHSYIQIRLKPNSESPWHLVHLINLDIFLFLLQGTKVDKL